MREKELKEKIKEFELIEDTFENDGIIYYKSKTYLGKLKAQLKTLQERNTEVKQAMIDFENKLRDNHFIMTEELLKKLLQKLELKEN